MNKMILIKKIKNQKQKIKKNKKKIHPKIKMKKKIK